MVSFVGSLSDASTYARDHPIRNTSAAMGATIAGRYRAYEARLK